MARPISAGKVRDNLDKTPRLGLTGLLYNFDVAGDKVKPEHERWLVANALPLLACDQAVGCLTGMASRSGSDSLNLALSQRRVENVKKVLADRGASPAKLNALWVGEEAATLAGVADGTEDEKARAVGVSVQLPPRSEAPRFRREDEKDWEDGFDPHNSSPAWLMLPLFERRKLVFTNGAGVRLTSAEPIRTQMLDPVTLRPVRELLVTSNRQVIQFVGHVPGVTRISGRDLVTGQTRPMLDVEVMTRKHVKLAFHFVTDPNNPKPVRTVASVRQMLLEARGLFQDQANVILDAVSEVPDTLHFDRPIGDSNVPPRFGLTSPVTTRSVGGELHPVLMNRANGAARVNIFFVWELETLELPRRDVKATADSIPGRSVIYEDDITAAVGTREGNLLAHELGHCFGLEHLEDDNPDRTRLMWPTADQLRGRLTRDEVRTIRANV